MRGEFGHLDAAITEAAHAGERVKTTASRLGVHVNVVTGRRIALHLTRLHIPVSEETYDGVHDKTPGCRVCGLRGEHTCLDVHPHRVGSRGLGTWK